MVKNTSEKKTVDNVVGKELGIHEHKALRQTPFAAAGVWWRHWYFCGGQQSARAIYKHVSRKWKWPTVKLSHRNSSWVNAKENSYLSVGELFQTRLFQKLFYGSSWRYTIILFYLFETEKILTTFKFSSWFISSVLLNKNSWKRSPFRCYSKLRRCFLIRCQKHWQRCGFLVLMSIQVVSFSSESLFRKFCGDKTWALTWWDLKRVLISSSFVHQLSLGRISKIPVDKQNSVLTKLSKPSPSKSEKEFCSKSQNIRKKMMNCSIKKLFSSKVNELDSLHKIAEIVRLDMYK